MAQVPISVAVTPEWDRYGDVFLSPTLSVGKTLPGVPISADYFSGWINADFTSADQDRVRNFLGGWSVNASGGCLTAARGTTWSLTSDIGVENHFMYPLQVSGSVSYGIPVHTNNDIK